MRRRNWNFPAKIRFELRRLKIIRSFTEPVSIEQNLSGDVELSLVVFTVHDSYSDCKLRRSGWTRDVDVFFQWLSALQFSGGGLSDVAAADGLEEALMMFSSLNGSQENGDGKRHCILVAASNPYPLPRPVSYPAMLNLEQSGNIEVPTSFRLADAELVAKAFPQCSVSLSVICSRKLPKLRAIYNAAKRDPQAADPPVDTSKNPNFLVLISEHFSEGCAAFSHTEMESLAPDQSLVEMDMTSVPPIARTAATSNSSAMNQQPISAGNIPAATVNFEPNVVTSVSGPVMSRGNLPGSQMMQSGIGMHQNVLSGTSTGMPWGQMLSDIREGIGAGSLTEPVMSRNLPGSQMMQRGIGMHQNVPRTGMPWGQLLSNSQGGVGAGSLTAPVMSQRNLPGSQMMQREIGMHQNVPSGMGTGMPSEIGTMMPTPGMTQQGQPGILPLGRNNSAEANMSLSQHQSMATSPSPQSGFVKIWEGNLSMVREEREPLCISRLQGFKRFSASQSLAANLPQTLQILDFVPKKHMIEYHATVRPHTGKAEILAFWAMEEHAILNSMQHENLGGIISLPSQTLFVYVSDRTFCLIGWLLPYEYPQLQAQPLYQLHPLQVQPLDRVEHLQAQPLDRVEHLQAQPLDRVEHLQAQPLERVEHLQAQPLDRVEHLQAQPLDRVEHLQAQPLDRVEHLQAQPLDRVEHLQAQPLDRVEHLQAQPLDRVEHLPALPPTEAEYQEILDFFNRSD